jgi:hypothetical protein
MGTYIYVPFPTLTQLHCPCALIARTHCRSFGWNPGAEFAYKDIRAKDGTTVHHCDTAAPLQDTTVLTFPPRLHTETDSGAYTCKINNSHWFLPSDVRVALPLFHSSAVYHHKVSSWLATTS